MFGNPVAIQLLFVAILSDCSRIARLPNIFEKWKTIVFWTSQKCFKIHMQLQWDFQVVMTCCLAGYWHTNTDSQSYEWMSLSYEKCRKSIQSVRVPPITIAMGLQKTGNPLAIERNAGRIRSKWDRCNPGSIRPTLVQSRGNGAVRVRSEIKPNLTAVRQVWALTRREAQSRAQGSSAILSVPRNPQKEAFWVITILPQSRPSYFAIRRIATGFRILGNPEAIQMDCAPIGPELRPLRFCVWIAILSLRLEPWL